MNKLSTFVLAIIICITAITIPLSANYEENETTIFTVESIISNGYNEIFGNNNETSKPYTTRTSQDTASITYDLAVDEDDPLKGFVTAQISLLINGKSCSSLVSGEVGAMELTNDKYWEGCLIGNLYVDGNMYNDIYVHFNKLDSRDNIRMSLSISTQSGLTSFMFGNLLLDEQTHSEIDTHRNYSNNYSNHDIAETTEPYSSIYQPIPGSEYSIIGNGFTNFSYGSLQYYSQRARAYYNAKANRLAISLKTYANDLSSYMAQNSGYYNASYVTGIHEMTSALTRINSNDYSYIVNIQNPGLYYNVTNSNLLLYNLFYDALNALGVPTNILQQVFASWRGSFSSTIYSDYSYIRMQSAMVDYFNYDDLDYGAPIVYQLSSSIPCNGTYAYSTSVVYKTCCTHPVYEPATGIFQGYSETITYYNAGTASSISTVYVQ